jgi:hypothetical protein
MAIDTTGFEYRNVFHDNPFLFMSDFQQAVKDGYRAVNNIAGYPSLQGILKEVRMFRHESIVDNVDRKVELHSVVVLDYDPMIFLLKCQSILLAGYEVDLDCPIAGIRFDVPYKCTFVRTEQADVKTAEMEMEQNVPVQSVQSGRRGRRGK